MTIRQASNSPTARLVVLAIGTFVLGVDGFVLPGLLAPIADDLSVSVAAAGQLTTAFAVAYAIGSPIISTVTGRLDRRVVIGAGMVVFLVGMVLQAVGPTYPTVLAGRIVAALGAAGFQANAYAVAGLLSPPERRARSFAVIGAGASLASVLGVPFGLLIGQWLGWRGTMWTIVALAGIAAVLAWVAVPPVHLPVTSLRSRVAVLRDTRMLLLLMVSAFVLVPLYLVAAYAAPVVGVSRSGAGAVLVALLVFGVGFFAGNRLVGRVADRFGPLRTLTVALAATAAVTAGLGAVQHWYVAALVMLFGLGAVGSFLFIPQQNRVYNAGGDVAAVALGLNGSMIYVGSALGAILGGVVLSTAGSHWLGPVAALVALAVLALTWSTAPERRAAPRPADVPVSTNA
ncbi:MAG TPA: MFS transporter [Actinocatenispora sp.]